MEHVEGASWRGYGNAEAHVEWNGMDMDPHYGSICGFRGMDLNPGCGKEPIVVIPCYAGEGGFVDVAGFA